jgi:hypothetical protein
MVELPPLPPLLVLNPADWDRIALLPQYGLAHVNRTRIVMGTKHSGLWTAVADHAWADLPDADRKRMADVYGTPPDLGMFADLVIVHELTHLTDLPSWLDGADIGKRSWSARVPRLLWVTELFANIGMQGYIAEREPESLPRLETAFEVLGGTAPSRFPFRRLSEMHSSVATPGTDGTNYVWFQFRLLILATRLWRAAGAAGFQRLHGVLHGPVLSDQAVFGVLAELDPAVADDVRCWA